MMTEMDIETSVYNVHLTRLIAREDFIKFTRRESTKTYMWSVMLFSFIFGYLSWEFKESDIFLLHVSILYLDCTEKDQLILKTLAWELIF
jgi:hypothetical protein